MIVSDYDRYPVGPSPDPFLAAARVLCGEYPSLVGFEGALFAQFGMNRVRRHPQDVAWAQLRDQVREVLGDRAVPCNCGRYAATGHAVWCVAFGRVQSVEASERWRENIKADAAAFMADPEQSV